MKSPEEVTYILDLVGLKGFTIWGNDAEEVVEDAGWWAGQAWRDPKLFKFPDHGLAHAKRVVDLGLQLAGYLERYEPLCWFEKLLFALAALLHDVGMQYAKYQTTGSDSKPEKVRRDHGMLGEKLVLQAAGGSPRWKHLKPLFARVNDRARIVGHVCDVAFAHQWEDKWRTLQQYPHKEPIGVAPGTTFWRPRILAGLLRLADELDCTNDRVPEVGRLKDEEFLSEEEKLHWTACYYVSAVGIDTRAGIALNLYWRRPIYARKKRRELIFELLDWLRMKHLREEIEQVRPYLVPEEVGTQTLAEAQLFHEPRWEELKPIRLEPPWSGLADALERYKRGRKKKPRRPRRPAIDSAGLPRSAALVERLEEVGEKDWVRDHFELETGFHVSHYGRLRHIPADRSLMLDLSSLLAEHVQLWGVDFICAIGTAAIKIAGLLSARTGIPLTFTFGSPVAHEYYSPFETEMDMPSGCNLLIIDDILGPGSVTSEKIEKIRKDFRPRSITFFALYSCGRSKEHLRTVSDVPFRYLVKMDQVEYQKPRDGKCRSCNRSGPIKEREAID